MKKFFNLSLLIVLSLNIISCSSHSKDRKGRELASDPCAQRYFVDENTYFDNYEICKDI